MRTYDTKLEIRIDKETLKQLKALAKKRKMSVSEIVRSAIYKELKRERAKQNVAKHFPELKSYLKHPIHLHTAKEILRKLEKLYEL